MAPTSRQRLAFKALHWVGTTLDAALQHPKRRQIIEFVAASKTIATPNKRHPMSKTQIIGLTGPAGCGKDTVADLLVAYAGFTKIAFADPLRAEVATAFGIGPEHLQRRETKEHPLSALALRRCLCDGFVGRMGMMHALAGQALDLDAPRSPRKIMQWWGTDYRRHQHPSYWVRQTSARVRDLVLCGSNCVVITDVRFADEAELIRSGLGGQLWQIERDGVAVTPGGHVSETTGSEFRPDAAINNSASIGCLHERVLEALASNGASPAAAA